MKNSLFDSLKEYGSSDFYPFHMPGHKRNPESGPLAGFYQLDITEIEGFDNLHQPQGMIKDAQKRAADLYQSEETYFLINGSTAGILSAVSAVAGRGRKLIAARNCHKAVYHAAFLNRLELEYLYPPVLEEFGLTGGISGAQAEEKIKEIAAREEVSLEKISTLIAGIVVTSPSYEGILSDMEGIVKAAHSYGIPVIADQAHGAHFGFHPDFPESAVAQGADLVICSVHKTLPAPTQTALLHHNGSLTKSEILKKYLRIYQSSSPSYLLMAGIDSCMELLEKEAEKRLEKLLSHRRMLTEKISGCRHIRCYPSMAEGKKEGAGVQESGRLVISVTDFSLTGQQLYDILRERYHLQMEMAASGYVVAILSMMDRAEGVQRLGEALCEIDERIEGSKADNKAERVLSPFHQQEIALPLYEAFMEENESIPLQEAENRIAADFINLYPPGIPLVVPGERLDRENLEIVKRYLSNGYTVQGISSNCEIKAVKTFVKERGE